MVDNDKKTIMVPLKATPFSEENNLYASSHVWLSSSKHWLRHIGSKDWQAYNEDRGTAHYNALERRKSLKVL